MYLINNETMDAITNGNIQYPNTQTLWKKELFKLFVELIIKIVKTHSLPPKSLVLRVTTAAPHHTMTKIPAKTADAWLSGAVKASRLIESLES